MNRILGVKEITATTTKNRTRRRKQPSVLPGSSYSAFAGLSSKHVEMELNARYITGTSSFAHSSMNHSERMVMLTIIGADNRDWARWGISDGTGNGKCVAERMEKLHFPPRRSSLCSPRGADYETRQQKHGLVLVGRLRKGVIWLRDANHNWDCPPNVYKVNGRILWDVVRNAIGHRQILCGG